MTRYLLAAEADKIQDFLFRSSKLREVVGSSQLLTRFCQEVPEALMKKRGLPVQDIVVADGGGFRILFDDRKQAEEFGWDLAELYRMAVDGSLTVAEPAMYDGDFQAASQAADEKLRIAKQRRAGGETSRHLPYIAICASCGIASAQAYKLLREDALPAASNPSNYVCYACRVKRAERQAGGDFLREFEGAVEKVSNAAGPLDWIDEPEEMARFDPRHYVAYLVADGNNVGKLFGQCQSPDHMARLSKNLTETVRASLAEPVAQVMRQKQRPETQGTMPALPLILGGDDVFILLPAPWALDFARHFCLAYEKRMGAALAQIPFQPEQPPTMTAAVVICKSSYPYRLAHQRGAALVKDAKRLSKVVALRDGVVRSMVHFTVILGNRLAESDEDTEAYRPSLAPYWAQDTEPSSEALSRAMPLSALIGARYDLRHMPARRLAHLRALFDRASLLEQDEALADWNRQLDALVERVGREAGNQASLERVLTLLGQPKAKDQGYWRGVRRIQQPCRAHGLPDLLDAWDFAYDLDRWRDDYTLERE